RPVVLLRLTRAGTLDVENDLRATIARLDVNRPRGLDQDFEAVLAESFDEVERFLLRQRLAACDFDQLAPIALHTIDHIIDGHLLAAGEGVLGVAPPAA